ncbi:MAG: PhoH family protein [Ignavibacteria bacterium]|jgi:PhoH-like ATPase
MPKYTVLDTNIILQDAHNIVDLAKDSIIVLPETVINEIDSKKSLLNEIGFHAKEFGRMMRKAEKLETQFTEDYTVSRRLVEGVEVHTILMKSYPDLSIYEPNIANDRRIVFAAYSYLQDNLNETSFITNDNMCSIIAEAQGFKVTDWKAVENTEFQFMKELTIPTNKFSRLHNLLITDIDPDYKLENYNYMFNDELTGQVKLGNIRNGYIDILGKETENELRRQDASPINSGQLFLSRAIQNPNIDIVVTEALAGSGKTVSAFSNAIRLVKKGEYGSITYIRASVDDVPKEEEVGFLSGNDEKMAVYLHPVHDTLDFLVRSRYKDSKRKGKEYEDFIESAIDEMKIKYNITAMTGLGMRGRTFSNTIAIIDEAQNMSKSSLQKVLTRFGKDCKIIIVGSNRQIDNPYVTKYTNGLSVILDACTKPQEKIQLHAVPLTKVVRSDIAEFAEKVFSK